LEVSLLGKHAWTSADMRLLALPDIRQNQR
jgi:hypothetical protein